MRTFRLNIVRLVLSCLCFSAAHADDLYKPNQFRSIVADNKAYQVGDNITILVYENSSSTTSAGTSSDKSVGVNISATSKHTNTKLGLDMGDEFEGKGKISRSGKLLAQLTVSVKSVDSTGLLYVSGDQVITVNDEKQEIKLEGKVRTKDIGENNTVISTRLSDAKISYIGDGILGDRQRPGLITRLFSWLGLI